MPRDFRAAQGALFYEAWLRNPAGVLVPIGTFNEGRKVTLWAGVSPKDYPSLTVTREQADGNQASSGEKVLVGTPAEPCAADSRPVAVSRRRPGARPPGGRGRGGSSPSPRDAQGSGRLLVREAGDVDGDEDVAEIVRQRGDRGVELAGLHRGLRLRVPADRRRGRADRAAGSDAAGGPRSASESERCCAACAGGSRGRPRCGVAGGARARARRSPGRDPQRPRGNRRAPRRLGRAGRGGLRSELDRVGVPSARRPPAASCVP